MNIIGKTVEVYTDSGLSNIDFEGIVIDITHNAMGNPVFIIIKADNTFAVATVWNCKRKMDYK